jgi:hypothetical protein
MATICYWEEIRCAAAPYDACEKRAGRVNGLAFTDFWE